MNTSTVAKTNVEQIDSRREAKSRKTSQSARIFEEARTLLGTRLESALPRALDQVDDALYDLADKSVDSDTQARYFDAMRVLRIKRPELLDAFNQELDVAVEKRLREPQPDTDPFTLPAAADFTLTLVEDEDLEESIAVTNMASRIRDRCHDEIFALDRRMSLLLVRPELEGDENPLGPEVISAAASGLTGILQVSIEIRLVVLKLLERHLVSAAQKSYEAINAELVRQGVLADLRLDLHSGRSPQRASITEQSPRPDEAVNSAELHSQTLASGIAQGIANAMQVQGFAHPNGSMQGNAGNVGVSQPGTAPLAPSAPVAAGQGGHGPTLHGDIVAHAGSAPAMNSPIQHHHLQVLQALEQALRSGSAFGTGMPAGVDIASDCAAEGGLGTAPQALAYLPIRGHALGELTALQRGVVGDLGGDGATIDLGGLALGATNVIHEIKNTDIAAELDGSDGLMIDLVAMMFDLILDDGNIANPIRALIGRLQIPMLKVAIVDKSFFSRKTHPARQLLNKLAEAGLGWGPMVEEDDPQYQLLESLVHGLLDRFDDDVEIFSEVLKQLDTFLANEKAALEETNWRTAKAAEQRQRLNQVRNQSRKLVEAAIGEHELPALIADFLREDWQQVLVGRLFQDGEDSPPVDEAVSCMDDLVWSITVQPSAEARRRLGELLPFLLQRLKNGLTALGVPKAKRDDFFRALSKIHLEAIKPHEQRTTAGEVPPPEPASDTGNTPQNNLLEPADGTAVGRDSKDISRHDLQIPDLQISNAGPNEASADLDCAADSTQQSLQVADEQRMQRAIELANTAVFNTAAERVQCQGMGSTLVCAWHRADGRLVVGHVGDSRLYRLRDWTLEQVTVDHTYRQELVDKGLCTMEEAIRTVSSNLITRAIGADAKVKPTVQTVEALAGDLFVACSDGLSDMLNDEAIAAILLAHPIESEDHMTGLSSALIDAANIAGGVDNISVGLLWIPAPIGQPQEIEQSGCGGESRSRTLLLADTHPGRKRAHNEDAVAIDTQAGLLVVADGVGGHNAGEVASALTIKVMLEQLNAHSRAPEQTESTVDLAAINALFWDDVKDQPAAEDALAHLSVIENSADDGLDELAALDSLDEPEPYAQASSNSDSSDLDSEEDDAFLAAVKTFKVGLWVEFGSDEALCRRARLAWISDDKARFLFTDRLGAQVAESTAHGLALELRLGRMHVLDHVPLFDRTISNITARLRRSERLSQTEPDALESTA